VRRLSIVLLLFAGLIWVGCSSNDTSASTSGATGGASTVAASSSLTPAVLGTVAVDFTGAPKELEPITATFSVEQGSKAWDAIKQALGEDRLTYQDFGGDLGIFITGFDGVEAEGNHFWEFRVNGEGADVGVSKYEVMSGDVLEFVYSSY
jgi:hypothetical protein